MFRMAIFSKFCQILKLAIGTAKSNFRIKFEKLQKQESNYYKNQTITFTAGNQYLLCLKVDN